jgi:hypothetical protein
MSILGSIAGGIGSSLLGGLFGGDDDDDGGSTRAKQMKRSPLQKELEKIAFGKLDEGAKQYDGKLKGTMPDSFGQVKDMMGNNQYQGQTNINPSDTQKNVSGQINSMLNQGSFGMSDKEMDKRMGQTKKNVNQNLENNIQNTFRGMNRRGMMDSDMNTEGLRSAQNKASSQLADAQTNMYLQNEQLANQERNNALSQGMNLSNMQSSQQQQNISNLMNQWRNEQNLQQQDIQNLMNMGQYEGNLEQSNIDRALNNFYQQQQLNQQPFNQAMGVLQGATLPLQQANAGIQGSNANANAQQQAGMWGALGNIGGTVMDNWSQSWFD